MKTELIYLWIEKGEHDCFYHQGFNFSPRYNVIFDEAKKRLTIEKIDRLNVFLDDRIQNLTAIIGENGTGKTTFIRYLTELGQTEENNENTEAFDAIVDGKSIYAEKCFLAVYAEDAGRVDGKIFLKIVNKLRKKEKIEIAAQKELICRVVKPGYIGNISHICLSNSAYGTGKENIEGKKISSITLMDSTLSAFYYDFYCRIYRVKEKQFRYTIKSTPFASLQRHFVEMESGRNFQMFLDILYYDFLNRGKFKFLGKSIEEFEFIIRTNDEIQEELEDSEADAISRALLLQLKNKGLWENVVYDLAAEILMVFREFRICEFNGASELFEQCKKFLNGYRMCEETEYYQNAIKEIGLFRNTLTSSKDKHYAKANLMIFNRLIQNIKDGYSFILKYLKVINLEMSSGERALLNMMSRIYFSSRIHDFYSDKDFYWNQSILLLIDEMDLYFHPEWQRKLIKELLKTIKEQFPDNYFQIVITSHSPIVLSDVPMENSIFLQRNAHGRICQVNHNAQTFGANIHTLYRDAFFLKNGLAMGEFAQATINQ